MILHIFILNTLQKKYRIETQVSFIFHYCIFELRFSHIFLQREFFQYIFVLFCIILHFKNKKILLIYRYSSFYRHSKTRVKIPKKNSLCNLLYQFFCIRLLVIEILCEMHSQIDTFCILTTSPSFVSLMFLSFLYIDFGIIVHDVSSVSCITVADC